MKQYLMLLFVYVFLAGLLIPSIVYASDDSTQLDRIEAKVKTVVTSQERILEVIDAEPLKGKKYGIEINLFRILIINEYEKSFSGSFSFFNVKPNVEISLPVYAWTSNSVDNDDSSVYTLDGHYRYFLGKRAQGFYMSGFSRFSALYGAFVDDDNSLGNNNRGATYKLGAGFGIGYRFFSNNGFYWGASMSLGRYIFGKNNQYRSSLIGTPLTFQDNEMIIDFEFFKFGYAF